MTETLNELNTLYNDIKDSIHTDESLVSIYTKGFYNQIKHHILIYQYEPFRFLFHKNCDKQVIDKVLDTLNKDGFEGVFIIQNSQGFSELVVPSINWTEKRLMNIYKLTLPFPLRKVCGDYFKSVIVCSTSINRARKIGPVDNLWSSDRWARGENETDKLEVELIGTAAPGTKEGIISREYVQG